MITSVIEDFKFLILYNITNVNSELFGRIGTFTTSSYKQVVVT